MPNRQFVESSPQASVSTPAQSSIGTSVGVVLSADEKRKGFMIQNTGTTVLKLAFGPAAAEPTQTVYHIALQAGTLANDATGGVYLDDTYTGDVWAISATAGGTAVVSEFKTGSPDWNQAGDWGTGIR